MYDSDKSDVILITCTAEIPAKSFAEIDSYTAPLWTVKRPTADDLSPSEVVVVPELIGANKKGIGFIGGIHVVLKAGTVTVGNVVGTGKDVWTGRRGNMGFHCLKVDGNDLYVRAGLSVPSTIFPALLSSPTGDGTNRWYSTFAEAEITEEGYGHWQVKDGGRSGTARNFTGDMNSGSGMLGIGITAEELVPDLYEAVLKSAPAGLPRFVHEIAAVNGDLTYWFEFEHTALPECNE